MTATPRTRSKCPVDVFLFQDYREFLRAYYNAKKSRGFSYRAFSRKAALGAPNYLKLVIENKRNLTSSMAERFAQACGLGSEATQYFMVLVAFNQATTVPERTQHYQKLRSFRRYRAAQRLDVAEAAYHSTWFLPAIRELVLSPHFREDGEWIARQLTPQIKPQQARQAIDVLLSLGLLYRTDEGRLQQQTSVVSTGSQTNGLHIRAYHQQMMHRAIEAMELVPALDRDISSLTLCLDRTGLAELKERLQAFRRELLELGETALAPSQVVQLNFQLFPLSADTSRSARRVSVQQSPKEHS